MRIVFCLALMFVTSSLFAQETGPSQKWKDTVDKGVTDRKWDAYDSIIKAEIESYNKRFKTKFDWLKVKAMVWVESGGPTNAAWTKRVIQIGNKKDPAYKVVKDGKEGSDLIVSEALKKELQTAKNIDKPKTNIQAGIAYLITRIAQFKEASIPVGDKKLKSYTVVSGDSFFKIAKKVTTTVEVLKESNPSVVPEKIKPGDKLDYYEAKLGKKIDKWREFSTAVIAKRYNGGGDKHYQAKLDYVIDEVFPKIKKK